MILKVWFVGCVLLQAFGGFVFASLWIAFKNWTTTHLAALASCVPLSKAMLAKTLVGQCHRGQQHS